MQDHLRNRAGTERRVYRGGAYRIRVRSGYDKVSHLYAVVEGATPALTFKEACSSGTPEAGMVWFARQAVTGSRVGSCILSFTPLISEHLRRHRVDIVSNFYRTLKQLLDDDKTVGQHAELIYYNGEARNFLGLILI